MFINESLNYRILEKTTNEAFQALWIEISFVNKKNNIDLAKPKSGAPGMFIFTGCRISENKRLWNCPPFGFPRYCLIM